MARTIVRTNESTPFSVICPTYGLGFAQARSASSRLGESKANSHDVKASPRNHWKQPGAVGGRTRTVGSGDSEKGLNVVRVGDGGDEFLTRAMVT